MQFDNGANGLVTMLLHHRHGQQARFVVRFELQQVRKRRLRGDQIGRAEGRRRSGGLGKEGWFFSGLGDYTKSSWRAASEIATTAGCFSLRSAEIA